MAESPPQRQALQQLLGEAYTLFAAASCDDALEYLRLTPIDVLIAAAEEWSPLLERLCAQAKALQPHCVTLCLAPGAPEEIPQVDYVLSGPLSSSALQRTLKQALDRQQLAAELERLRHQKAQVQPIAPANGEHGPTLASVGHLLRHFAKAFSTPFDLEQALGLFLEAVGDFLRPSRMAVLLPDAAGDAFLVRAQRGLPAKVTAPLRLPADAPLVCWLRSEARLLHRAELEGHRASPEALAMLRPLQALKAVVCVPLLASGTLVGILTLGERVTGTPYGEAELETLFSLASHMAVAVQGIALHHAVQEQKVFTEKILRYMSSGVITIGTDEKIRLCNHRAAQILGTSWERVLHQDLRTLPSPLGDLLYETLRDGVAYDRQEVVLAAGKVPLQVSTYQIFDQQGAVAGSAMVFEDLTAQKQLEAERRRADQLDFLNKVVGRMAHEIKNPLVSIQTFVELLEERYDDAEFRHTFCQVVRRDVRAINSITDKLVSFASKLPYAFEYGDLNAVVQRLAHTGVLPPPNGEKPPEATVRLEVRCAEELPPVKLDPEQLLKALGYLVAFLSQGMPEAGRIRVTTRLGYRGLPATPHPWVCVVLTGEGCTLPAEELELLSDPFSMERRTLVDVGPCVSQKIVEEHGGRLEVRREKNGDTTFVVALPATTEAWEAA
ncbi:MAG: hypothetical protein KatS3mg131_0598 [Candidatus Tectimicrobiota bacterium]|nr:MAG: hypothetical protein KatS3mg131_0598 [Candidatus Tectomicrobia bacterium]